MDETVVSSAFEITALVVLVLVSVAINNIDIFLAYHYADHKTYTSVGEDDPQSASLVSPFHANGQKKASTDAPMAQEMTLSATDGKETASHEEQAAQEAKERDAGSIDFYEKKNNLYKQSGFLFILSALWTIELNRVLNSYMSTETRVFTLVAWMWSSIFWIPFLLGVLIHRWSRQHTNLNTLTGPRTYIINTAGQGLSVVAILAILFCWSIFLHDLFTAEPILLDPSIYRGLLGATVSIPLSFFIMTTWSVDMESPTCCSIMITLLFRIVNAMGYSMLAACLFYLFQ